MANFAQTLKSEIARIARKEIRQVVDPLRKANAGLRSEIASLKRKIAEQDRAIAALSKSHRAKKPAVQAEDADVPSRQRISAKGVKSLRSRLGLSAEQLAGLVGVSGQTVYLWEHGKTAPRAAALAGLARLRSMGKKEVRAMLVQQGTEISDS